MVAPEKLPSHPQPSSMISKWWKRIPRGPLNFLLVTGGCLLLYGTARALDLFEGSAPWLERYEREGLPFLVVFCLGTAWLAFRRWKGEERQGKRAAEALECLSTPLPVL